MKAWIDWSDDETVIVCGGGKDTPDEVWKLNDVGTALRFAGMFSEALTPMVTVPPLTRVKVMEPVLLPGLRALAFTVTENVAGAELATAEGGVTDTNDGALVTLTVRVDPSLVVTLTNCGVGLPAWP